ncbi:DEAD/DEAH box helicase [Granulicoccus phenolivorans]|uniref:DEAD/DEAH box helicase n=1 Tax=Granulicoccus phenolivorans TaxID=266854 RepID=UPI000478989F|nr:DEAD/DEAH box helicase [Granulicoccus phenolivorans]
MQLTDQIPSDPDSLYAHFTEWATERGISLYPHQDDAAIEIFSGNNLIMATPTGSGKSLVATAAHFAAIARGEVSFYTAPIKALVSEKFFALCQTFGAENVGMITGDASVNADAPIICCTAEILANIALREGAEADIGQVVADEFHFYSEPDRGWAWQVPLLALPQAQFVLMSATLGDVDWLRADLKRRTGRDTVEISNAQRPVPLHYSWSLEPLHEKLEELVTTHQAPVYVVHFTQKEALERAQTLLSLKLSTREEKDRIAAEIGAFQFGAGFGRTLSKLVRHGIGIHHAGMLPKYRRLVEQLAQTGLLKIICGTDTLGVGINVPIRTVLFTALTKFDGSRTRRLKSREFHQIAGRAGRAGYDTVGYVVAQAPEYVIENERALAKAGDDPKKRRKVQRKKPPEGFVNWSQDTFEKLIDAEPEPLVSRMQVTASMVLNVCSRDEDPWPVMKSLMQDNHSDVKTQRKLSRRALQITRGLLDSGVLIKLTKPDPNGRTCSLTEQVQEDFALNQPLAPFAVAALELLDPEDPYFHLDAVSVIEAILDDPFPVLLAQQYEQRGKAVAEMKDDGIEYEERMELLEEVSWPKPLEETLTHALNVFCQTHPWVDASALSPKSVVRDMYERAADFTQYIAQYKLARSEGLVLRYLTDAYRTLRQTIPDRYKSPELEDLIEWLGETVRQTDSSLLDEWESLTDPEAVARAAAAVAAGKPPAPPRPVTGNERVFRTMVRNAMFRRVELAADDAYAELGALEDSVAHLTEPPLPVVMTAAAWDEALGAYWDEHDELLTDADARGPGLLQIETARGGRLWQVTQVLHDPEGDHDWRILAEVDLDLSDQVGSAVVRGLALERL